MCVGGEQFVGVASFLPLGGSQGSKSGSQVSMVVVCSHKDTVIGSFPYKICFRC